MVENRRWSEGLHQSVEAKEGVEIQVKYVEFMFTVASILFYCGAGILDAMRSL